MTLGGKQGPRDASPAYRPQSDTSTNTVIQGHSEEMESGFLPAGVGRRGGMKQWVFAFFTPTPLIDDKHNLDGEGCDLVIWKEGLSYKLCATLLVHWRSFSGSRLLYHHGPCNPGQHASTPNTNDPPCGYSFAIKSVMSYSFQSVIV